MFLGAPAGAFLRGIRTLRVWPVQEAPRIGAAVQGLHDAAHHAATAIRERSPGFRWFLACDSDADGLCAAAVMARALARAGHRFLIRASRDKTAAAYQAILEEDWDGLMMLDKGTSHLSLLAKDGRPVIVIDHHNLPQERPRNVVLVNPRAEGLDGSRDASSSTTAVAVALALGEERNLDLGPIGLSGAIGDWQHMGGWQGWNKELLASCREEGHVRDEVLPALIGVDLAHAVAHRRPAVPGIGGIGEARDFLQGLGMDPAGETEDLDHQDRTRLVSALTLRMLAHRAPEEALDGLVRPTAWNTRLDTSLRHVFRVVDACGRSGRAGLGLAYLLGDADAAGEARACFQEYKASLSRAIEHLEKEGAERRQAMQVAWTEDDALTGMVGGIGMTHILGDRSVPAVVLAKRRDGAVQVSTRGTYEQVEAGLDLGQAVAAAAARVDAEGGGHDIAAGTVVDPEAVDALLVALDEALLAQRFLPSP